MSMVSAGETRKASSHASDASSVICGQAQLQGRQPGGPATVLRLPDETQLQGRQVDSPRNAAC